jgi:hypothetical protein
MEAKSRRADPGISAEEGFVGFRLVSCMCSEACMIVYYPVLTLLLPILTPNSPRKRENGIAAVFSANGTGVLWLSQQAIK